MRDYLAIRSFRVPYYFLGLIAVFISVYLLYDFKIIIDSRYLIGVGAVGIAVISMLYNAYSLKHRINAQEENNRILITKHTFDVVSDWNDEMMVKKHKCIVEFVKKNSKF